LLLLVLVGENYNMLDQFYGSFFGKAKNPYLKILRDESGDIQPEPHALQSLAS
jgi:hypothetical protein